MAEQENVQCAIIEMDKVLLETMKAKLRHVNFAGESREPCTIYRMLPIVRDKHSENYEPKIISIGPLHARKITLEPMESVKWKYLRNLLHRCPDDEDKLERCINKVKELEVRARKKYAEVIELDSDAFVQIMVVDACFIIELLIKWHWEGIAELVAETWTLPLLNIDLILLENQIPFFILQSLFELLNVRKQVEDEDIPVNLMDLAIAYISQGKYVTVTATVDPENVHHLLHLYQLSFLPTSTQVITTAPSSGHMVMNTIKKIGSVASGSLFRLLASFLYCRRLPLKYWQGHQHLTYEERLEAPRMIPSATELEESGVEFKRKKATSLLDVTFRDGVMEIPFLSIEDNTVPLFRNLIAFEQCCPTSGDHFTSYAALLDKLVNTPKDVAILKKCGIIESMLGQDEEVADLFNSLCKDAYLDFETHYLAQLFKDVNQYCEVDRHRWRARLMRDYFGTPWSIISVIAAIILLILTVVQAIYTILDYHKPPK